MGLIYWYAHFLRNILQIFAHMFVWKERNEAEVLKFQISDAREEGISRVETHVSLL